MISAVASKRKSRRPRWKERGDQTIFALTVRRLLPLAEHQCGARF
jgi:hypothetical protein